MWNRKDDEHDKYQYFAKKTGIKGIGVDIVSIPQITRLIDLHNRETLTMVFTYQEQNYCQSQSNSHVCYAVCFAIKEAVGKALGIGLAGIDWNEIEADLTQARPIVLLSGRAENQAQKLGIKHWLIEDWEWCECVLVNVLALS